MIGIGSAIGGITELFSGLTTGTASCGARPLFKGAGRNQYNDCVSRSQDLKKEQSEINAKNSKRNILIIGGILLVAIIAVVIIKKSGK